MSTHSEEVQPAVGPLLVMALSNWAALMIEWGSLRWIDHAPPAIWIGSTFIAICVATVIANKDWLNFKNRKYFPVSLTVLMIAWVALVALAYYLDATSNRAAEPVHDARGIASPSNSAPKRTKQTINELLGEVDSLLALFVKNADLLIEDWRTTAVAENPERVCLNLNGQSLREKITSVAGKLEAAQREIGFIYDKNEIDHVELNKAFGASIGDNVIPDGFYQGAQSLRRYASSIQLLGDHPTCDSLVKDGTALNIYAGMMVEYDKFRFWTAQARQNLASSRNALREELRNAP